MIVKKKGAQMPFKFNFDNCYGAVKEVKVRPNGWKRELTIEYGPAQAHTFDPLGSVVWRIKGTTHTFSIYEKELNERIKDGDYAAHFKEVLEGFRKDYLSWWKDKRYEGCEWRDEYKAEYGNLIEPDGDKDNESKSKTNRTIRL